MGELLTRLPLVTGIGAGTALELASKGPMLP